MQQQQEQLFKQWQNHINYIWTQQPEIKQSYSSQHIKLEIPSCLLFRSFLLHMWDNQIRHISSFSFLSLSDSASLSFPCLTTCFFLPHCWWIFSSSSSSSSSPLLTPVSQSPSAASLVRRCNSITFSDTDWSWQRFWNSIYSIILSHYEWFGRTDPDVL